MSGTCGAPVGGRRRRSRRTRKHRGGNGYGFTGETIGTAGMVHNANMTSTPDGKPYTPLGGRRRRKSRKGSRKSRRKSRKGGGSVSSVGYGFTGEGSRGLADATGYNANPMPNGVQSV